MDETTETTETTDAAPDAAAPPPAQMSDAEVRELALGILEGRVFTSLQVADPRDLPMVFMPIALGGEEVLAGLVRDQIAMIWEWLDKAGPLAINGRPSFFSFHRVNVTDTARVQRKYDEFKAARDAVR